jgi:hypothetical protein
MNLHDTDRARMSWIDELETELEMMGGTFEAGALLRGNVPIPSHGDEHRTEALLAELDEALDEAAGLDHDTHVRLPAWMQEVDDEMEGRSTIPVARPFASA